MVKVAMVLLPLAKGISLITDIVVHTQYARNTKGDRCKGEDYRPRRPLYTGPQEQNRIGFLDRAQDKVPHISIRIMKGNHTRTSPLLRTTGALPLLSLHSTYIARRGLLCPLNREADSYLICEGRPMTIVS